MKSNLTSKTVFVLMALAILIACVRSPKEPNNANLSKEPKSVEISEKAKMIIDAEKRIKDYETAYGIIRATLKGATISDTIKNIKAFYFSNSQTKDSFLLIVPSGLIAKTKSELMIKTFDGRVIYADSFNTDYFIREIFEPDTIPQNYTREVQDQYIIDYINSITKEQFEKYIDKPILKFFDKIYIDKAYLKPADTEIVDKESFDEVYASDDTKIIWFPCFNCDEGTDCIGYSKKKQKAVKIVSSD